MKYSIRVWHSKFEDHQGNISEYYVLNPGKYIKDNGIEKRVENCDYSYENVPEMVDRIAKFFFNPEGVDITNGNDWSGSNFNIQIREHGVFTLRKLNDQEFTQLEQEIIQKFKEHKLEDKL